MSQQFDRRPCSSLLWHIIIIHIIIICNLPFQGAYQLFLQLLYCNCLYLSQVDCCHCFVPAEVGSGSHCCCSFSGCVAGKPAPGEHAAAENHSSGSQTERGDHIVQQFLWRHICLLLESQRRRMVQMNCASFGLCNLEALHNQIIRMTC